MSAGAERKEDGHTDDMLFFSLSEKLSHQLRSLEGLLRMEDPFLAGVLGRDPREIQLGEDTILRGF